MGRFKVLFAGVQGTRYKALYGYYVYKWVVL